MFFPLYYPLPNPTAWNVNSLPLIGLPPLSLNTIVKPDPVILDSWKNSPAFKFWQVMPIAGGLLFKPASSPLAPVKNVLEKGTFIDPLAINKLLCSVRLWSVAVKPSSVIFIFCAGSFVVSSDLNLNPRPL